MESHAFLVMYLFLFFQHYLIYLTGVKNAELLFNDTVEAEVGQNITISCFKDFIDYGIVDVKWTKNGGTKLAVYNLVHKEYRFWPNVTIQAKENDEKHLISADLYLSRVSKWDSGTYSCEVAKFPLGYFTSETKLTVKGKSLFLFQHNVNIIFPHFFPVISFCSPISQTM